MPDVERLKCAQGMGTRTLLKGRYMALSAGKRKGDGEGIPQDTM